MTSAGDVMFKDDVTDDAAVTCVVFADDAMKDASADDRVTSLESRHRMSLQSMKERLLSSVSAAPCRRFSSRVSTAMLRRDTDIAILSVCPSFTFRYCIEMS